jgi:hypothetical protein
VARGLAAGSARELAARARLWGRPDAAPAPRATARTMGSLLHRWAHPSRSSETAAHALAGVAPASPPRPREDKSLSGPRRIPPQQAAMPSSLSQASRARSAPPSIAIPQPPHTPPHYHNRHPAPSPHWSHHRRPPSPPRPRGLSPPFPTKAAIPCSSRAWVRSPPIPCLLSPAFPTKLLRFRARPAAGRLRAHTAAAGFPAGAAVAASPGPAPRHSRRRRTGPALPARSAAGRGCPHHYHKAAAAAAVSTAAASFKYHWWIGKER